jgi:hypothetical protein
VCARACSWVGISVCLSVCVGEGGGGEGVCVCVCVCYGVRDTSHIHYLFIPFLFPGLHMGQGGPGTKSLPNSTGSGDSGEKMSCKDAHDAAMWLDKVFCTAEFCYFLFCIVLFCYVLFSIVLFCLV